MDILSLAGLVLALIAIVGGSVAKGAGLSALWNFAAFLIVIVGTLGAVLLQSGLPAFKRAMAIARSAGPFEGFEPAMRKRADQIVVVSRFTFTRDQTLQTQLMGDS